MLGYIPPTKDIVIIVYLQLLSGNIHTLGENLYFSCVEALPFVGTGGGVLWKNMLIDREIL